MRRKIVVLSAVLAALFAALLVRLFAVQVLSGDSYRELREKQLWRRQEIPAPRGTILDRRGELLAVSLPVSSVYADPSRLKDLQGTAALLAPILGVSQGWLLDRLSRPKRFVWLRRHVTQENAQKVRELDIAGIDLRQEMDRAYPLGRALAHWIGFVGVDQKGLEGLESCYEALLQGEPGIEWVCQDALRRPIPSLRYVEKAARLGKSLRLTIDARLQFVLDDELEGLCDRTSPVSATGLLLDLRNGEILAGACRPTFDPHQPGVAPPDARRNRAVTDSFEPGSVLKPLLAAGALALGKISPRSMFDCEKGEFRVRGRRITDVHAMGLVPLEEVLVQSSNIGITKVSLATGAAAFQKILRAYRFGRRTGMVFPGEASGFVQSSAKWSAHTQISVGLGYEIMVTPVQLAGAFTALGNGGNWVCPRIVVSLEGAPGGPEPLPREFAPACPVPVLPRTVAATILGFLEGVFERGTARSGKSQIYRIAGKTGTAKKVDANGKYSSTRKRLTLVAMAPAENPRLVIVLTLDEPKTNATAGAVLAPTVSKVLDRALQILEVPRSVHLTVNRER